MRHTHARVVFDSAVTPSLAQVRSGQPDTRTLQFEADELRVDVVLLPKRPGARRTVYGQLSHPGRRGTAHAALVRIAGSAGRVMTDGHGEFSLDWDGANDLALEVQTEHETVLCRVPPVSGA